MRNEVSLLCHAICEVKGIVQLTDYAMQCELDKRGLSDWLVDGYDVREDTVDVYVTKLYDVKIDPSDYEPEVDYDLYGNSFVSYPEVDEYILFDDYCRFPDGLIFDWVETEDGSVITWEELFGDDDE
jgi:hypothetical protein